MYEFFTTLGIVSAFLVMKGKLYEETRGEEEPVRPRVQGDSDCDETPQSMNVEIEQQTAATSAHSQPRTMQMQDCIADSKTGRPRLKNTAAAVGRLVTAWERRRIELAYK